MIPPGTADYQLSADWDLYMQAVRGTDSTVAFKFMTSSVSTAVHVLIHTGVAHVPRFLVRMLLPLRAHNSRSYLRSTNDDPPSCMRLDRDASNYRSSLGFALALAASLLP
jgi:hypothetical protein